MIRPAPRAGGQGNDEFVIQVRTKKKHDTLRFSSENMHEILTEALAHQAKFADARPALIVGFYRLYFQLHFKLSQLILCKRSSFV